MIKGVRHEDDAWEIYSNLRNEVLNQKKEIDNLKDVIMEILISLKASINSAEEVNEDYFQEMLFPKKLK